MIRNLGDVGRSHGLVNTVGESSRGLGSGWMRRVQNCTIASAVGTSLSSNLSSNLTQQVLSSSDDVGIVR